MCILWPFSSKEELETDDIFIRPALSACLNFI